MDNLIHHIKTAINNPEMFVTVLTGAGISAASGIPTFRGPEGYWRVGSNVYHPQEMATSAMFKEKPEAVWQWYIYRRNICLSAQPNDGHHAIVDLEKNFENRFRLITQNVDTLHLRAGSSTEQTYEIHGNISQMRCSRSCSLDLYPIPDIFDSHQKDQPVTGKESAHLKCPDCGAMTRPHVLWFDEAYDEYYFKFETALSVAAKTSILIVVGTSGATTLPNHVGIKVLEQGGIIFDINPDKNPFSEMATRSGGCHIQKSGAIALPELISQAVKTA